MSLSETITLLLDPGYRLPIGIGLGATILLSILACYVTGARLLLTGFALAQVASLGAALSLHVPIPAAPLAALLSGVTAALANRQPLRRLPADAGLLLLFVGSGAAATLLVATGSGEVHVLDLLNGQLLIAGAAEARWLAGSALLLGIVWVFGRGYILLGLTQPDYASQSGLPAHSWTLVALTAIGIAVGVAFPALGVLLTVALLTCPGLVALAWARNLTSMPLHAVGTGLSGYLIGIVIAFATDWPPGPTITAALVVVTLLSLSVEALLHRNTKHRCST